MKLSPFSHRTLRRWHAFSLLEVLVAVGLMSIVILALYSMFDQTQKALRQNAAQTDVSEAGRAAIELIVRDLERAWATRVAEVTNNVVIRRTYSTASLAELGDGYSRDTAFHELFLLSRPDTGQAPGLGLFVASETNALERTSDYIGTLYRYEVPLSSAVLGTNNVNLGAVRNFSPQTLLRPGTAPRTFNSFWRDFADLSTGVRADSSRLIDGVVFFRAFAYGPNGQILDRTTLTTTNLYPNDIPPDVQAYFLTGPGKENVTTFGNAALPTTLEVEMGTLPPRLLSQFRSLPNENLKTNFLARNFANILVFRQRIALRTALQ
jgi:type II secretory pathway pseudopilin PulG